MEITIDTTKSIDEIIKQVEEAKAKQEPKRWRANKYEDFYVVYVDNKIRCFFDARESVYDKLYEIGNYFQTKQEAEQEARLRDFEQRVAARIKELNGDKVHKFDHNSSNFSIEINVYTNNVSPRYWSHCFLSQRGWWSNEREVIKQVIQEFHPEKFIKWARGDL